jgi:hypothetical protein
MKRSSVLQRVRHRWGPGLIGVGVVTLALLTAVPASAIDLSGEKFTLNLDTTLTWGVGYRVDDRDMSIVGLANGGTAYSVNGDDGNLNYDTGIYSNALTAIVELDFAYKNFGFFLRGRGLYDYENEQNDRERTMLTDERVGSRAELLDAFAWLKFPFFVGNGEIRVGQQVVSWGESTFIQGGINVINPIDVSALRTAGSELREALLPVGMVFLSLPLANTLTLEGFYQYNWEEIIIDPPGTYFSTNDFAGRGGEYVMLGFGAPSELSPWLFPWLPDPGRPPLSVPRAPTVEADDSGQYGAALRLFVPGLGNTEFGLYYMNYHSRLPYVNGIAGTVEGLLAAQAAGAATYAFFGVPPGVSPEVDAAARGAATDAFAGTGRYFISYPEDIKLYGLSWNAQLGTSGIAFQGEVSYRPEMPFLVDDVELLFAALSPLNPLFAALNQVVPGGSAPGAVIDGGRELDWTQLQFTLTKFWSRFMGADQFLFLLEGGVGHAGGMPSQDELRFEGPGTYTSGNPIMATDTPGAGHTGKPAETSDHFATPTSWGYRLVMRWEYLRAIGAWNLRPRLAWAHDVDGISPAPGGAFIEGAKAVTVGVDASYQNAWLVDLSYTSYMGAGRYNLINDRDFVAASVKFSF